MNYTIYDYLGLFFLYAFLGWLLETTVAVVRKKHMVNRGFLNGPLCAIYGITAVFMTRYLYELQSSPVFLFLGCVIIATAAEWIAGHVLERIGHGRWWDYSKRPFNIKGRVCLLNSTLFGLLCLFLSFDLNPRIESLLAAFSMDFKWGFLVAFFLYFAADFALAVKSALGINLRLRVLAELREELQEKYQEWSAKLEFAQLEEKILNSDIREELLEKIHKKQKEVGFFERRLMKSFPEMVNKSLKKRKQEEEKG